MKVKPKLYLNGSPQTAEEGSLAFARNMKIDNDGNLVSDYGYENIQSLQDYNIVGHIVGLDNKIYLFTDKEEQIKTGTEFITTLGNNLRYAISTTPILAESNNIYYFSAKVKIGDNIQIPTEDEYKLSVINSSLGTDYDDYYSFKLECASNTDYAAIEAFNNAFLDKIEEIVSKFTTIKSKDRSILVKGPDIHYALISHNMEIEESLLSISPITQINIENGNRDICNYTVIDNKTEEVGVYKTINKIVEYDEINETANELESGWKYNGGEISGYVSTNISGEKILTIGEYKEGTDIPLKHINLSYCKNTDDESIYCQAPICPTANLILRDTYVKTIPNGVYVFFIRYKIRKNVYTNWFLCSRPIYAGCSTNMSTFQGGLKYINLHKDSAKSFIFDLIFAQEENKKSYKEFQLGFIINHDDATDARIWKHFNIDTKTIYFDYENVEETNIDDLLKTTYELYNVKNITAFKNKLYISNYKETNFNYNINIENIIDLDVIDNYNTSISSEIPKASLSGYELNYNTISKYFDKTTTGLNMYNLLKKDYFDYTVNKLSKYGEATAEKNNIGSFTLQYIYASVSSRNIAFITDVENRLHNNCIFGKSFSIGKDADLSKIGLKCIGYDSLGFTKIRYYYTPIDKDVTIQTYNNNPLYHLGFSFAFGAPLSGEYKDSQIFNAYSLYHKPYVYENKNSWNAYSENFNNDAITLIKNTIKKEIEDRSFFAKAYIIISEGAKSYKIGYKDIMSSNKYAGNDMTFEALYSHIEGFNSFITRCHADYQTNSYKYYTDSDLDILNPEFFNTNNLNSTLEDNIKNWIFDTIHPIAKGIDVTPDGNYLVLDLSAYGGNTEVRTKNISIVFKKIDFEVEIQELKKLDGEFTYDFSINMSSQEYISNCSFAFNSLITDSANKVYSQVPSLMPFSKYRTYIHFVDNRNIITNGIKIKDIDTNHIINNNSILSLAYKLNMDLSDTYKSFFISIKNIGDIIIEGFGYKKLEDGTHILNFLELDTLLYNINDNIIIIDNEGTTITEKAKYYSSGSSTPSLAFGNCGYVSWDNDEKDYTGKILYIKIIRNFDTVNDNSLVKASGYIPLTKTDNYIEIIDPYYGSWFCSITKPDFDLSSTCYVSGRDIYSASRNANTIKLEDFKNYVNISPSKIYNIRSNFNLNYLSLTEDIADSIFSINGSSSGNKQVAKVINSAILSYIYELKAMYKDFMNKTFNAYDEDYKIQFDNTIRVSNVLSDETFNNSVFKFDATDYYNIPTDRGIIVSLFAIGNIIYAHTKGSLYKFDATQTISATDEDIKLQEAEPFEVGLNQVFDSQYGYGGIENKEAGCITFDSYFFYDSKSNHIFAYSGNNQIQLIDGSIYKFLTYYKPTICKTVHDIANKRILFEFTLPINEETSYPIITLSYNYKSKSFVSIHDITLNNCFTSINTVYSYNNNNFIKLFDTSDYYISQELLFKPLNLYKLYGTASARSYLIFNNISNPFNISIILFPQQYLKEVLNSVSYIGNIIETDINSSSGRTEDGIRYSYNILKICTTKPENPIKSFNVLTDICESNTINYTIDDTVRPNSLLDYKGFKYDKGTWNINYFRDNNNNSDIYKYNDVESDNKSLIYGKFFILNFSFITNKPIKLEEVFINSEKY